jgi:hypothetical protein
MSNQNLEQKHPQSKQDGATVNDLLQVKLNPSELDLVELARLIIRYRNFPGARDIQRDLQVVLDNWQLTEAQLYTQTRAIHAIGMVYRRNATGEQQDWT